MLCTAGAPLESLNCHGLAPLHIAAADGDVVAIRLLVDGGANVHVRSGNGAYPLAFAERNGHAAAAALLKKLYEVDQFLTQGTLRSAQLGAVMLREELRSCARACRTQGLTGSVGLSVLQVS